MNLITLGDSFTHNHTNEGWAYYLSNKINCNLINFAEAAGGNTLQIKLFQEFLLDNDITNDIVIWQIGLSFNYTVRLELDIEHYTKMERMDRLLRRKRFYHYIKKSKNKFDNKHRIDLFSFSPMFKQFTSDNVKIDEAQTLQDLLFMFTIIKKICPKILILRGKDDFVNEKYWIILKKLLMEKNINFLEESIVDWCKQNNLPFESDQFHPTKNSYESFCDDVIIKELNKLNWI